MLHPTLMHLALMVHLFPCDPVLLPMLLGQGDAPYAASLRPRPTEGGACSGAILDARWILTAAHCLQRINNQTHLEVFAGVTDVSGNLREAGQRRLSDTIVIHPSYKGDWAQYDVALVRLERGFAMSRFVNAIPLSGESWGNNVTVQCQAPGFGVIQSNAKHPLDHRLKAHRLNVTRPCQCAAALSAEKGDRLMEGWVCSAPGPHSGPCRGDSGAPLVCGGQLRAVTSATFYIYDPDTCDISRDPPAALCAGPHVLNIFIDIHPYLDWINRTVHASSSGAATISISITLLWTLFVSSELLRQRGKVL